MEATVPGLIRRTLDRHGNRPALRVLREGTSRSLLYDALDRQVQRFARGLLELGVDVGEPVAIWSSGIPQATVADLAILHAGGVPVPLHPATPIHEAEALLQAAEPRILLAQGRSRLRTVLDLQARLTALETVVALDPSGPLDARVLALDEVLAMGDDQASMHPETLEARLGALTPEHGAGLVPTEGGPTGPRLIPVTHRNLVSTIEGFLQAVPLGPEDAVLTAHPPSVAFRRVVGLLAPLAAGAAVVHARPGRALLAELHAGRPTVLAGGPHLVLQLRDGLTRMEAEDAAAAVGGRLRFLLTGGAPVDADTLAFFTSRSLDVHRAYSLTEAPVAAVSSVGSGLPDEVGRPLRGIEVRLGDAGQILLRGPPVAAGGSDGDRWLSTGDVGALDAEGRLHVLGPRRDLLVLPDGSLLAPSLVETRLALASPPVSRAIVVAPDGVAPGALLTLDDAGVQAWAEGAGMDPERYEDPRDIPGIRDALARAVAAVNETLPEARRVARFDILPGALLRSAGELTPSGRLRCATVLDHHAGLAAGLSHARETGVPAP